MVIKHVEYRMKLYIGHFVYTTSVSPFRTNNELFIKLFIATAKAC